ncbi:unnamed protein product [Blepharisma stoltei]|uniref:Lectin n=1 Tax=Blepharisma stoltei TaxID=1481888 RepID=A0AAU9IX08_9CILI|nr:unnamed protein product [Blepharisma stoltei]
MRSNYYSTHSVVTFIRAFNVQGTPSLCKFTAIVDDFYDLYVNDIFIASNTWNDRMEYDVTSYIVTGANKFKVVAANTGGPGWLPFSADIEYWSGKQ